MGCHAEGDSATPDRHHFHGKIQERVKATASYLRSNSEIAGELRISIYAVKYNNTNIFGKRQDESARKYLQAMSAVFLFHVRYIVESAIYVAAKR